MICTKSTYHPLFDLQPAGGSGYPFATLQDNIVLHKMLGYLSTQGLHVVLSQLTECYSALLNIPILDPDHLSLYLSWVAIAAR
jgi:hypothetical protein